MREMKEKRNRPLNYRESKNLSPEKLYEILSKIYPERIVDEVFPKLIEQGKVGKDNA